jgi:HK97 family phage portal protein
MAKRKPKTDEVSTSPEKFISQTVTFTNMLGGVTFPDFNQRLAVRLMTGWRYAAMNKNADACASTPLRMYTKRVKGRTPTFEAKGVSAERRQYLATKAGNVARRKSAEWGEDIVEVEGEHPLIELLNNVNPIQDGYDFAWARYMYMQATGNAYMHPVIDKATGFPYELWTMPPQWIEAIPSEVSYLAGWRYGAEQISQEYFGVQEVIHFKHAWHPFNNWYGYGPMEAGWNVVCQDLARNQSDLAFFENNSRPDYAIISKGTNDPKALERITAAVEGRSKGPRKTGKVLAITGDVELKPLQFPPKDLAGVYEITEQLAAVFGVPITLLKANDPNLASAETGYASWREGTIQPMLLRDEQVLNQRLIPMFGLKGQAFLAYDNPVPANKEFEKGKAVAFVQAGIWTPNEARQMDGMDALPGGDMLATMGGVGMGGMEAQIDAEPTQDAGKPTQPQATSTLGDQPANATNEGLNGAQLSSAVTILQQMSGGTLAPEAARELLIAAGLEPEVAGRMVSAQSKIKIEEPEPASPKVIPKPVDNAVEKPAAKSVEELPAIEQCDGKECDHDKPSGLEDWPDAVKESRKAIESQPEDDGGDAGDDVREGEGITPAMLMRRNLNDLFKAQYQRIGQSLMSMPSVQKMLGGLITQVDIALDYSIDAWKPGRKVASSTLSADIAAALGPSATADMVQAVKPYIQASLAGGARWGLQRVGKPPTMFDVTNPAVINSLDNYTIRLAGTVNSSTIDMITRDIQNGLASGQSMQEMAAQLQNGVPANRNIQPGYRSVMIARTESARAYVAGEEEGWKESGIVAGKRWMLAAGACEFCIATAAKFNVGNAPVKLGEPFYKLGSTIEVPKAGGGVRRMQIDYAPVEGAPLHPNCRCDVEPVLE